MIDNQSTSPSQTSYFFGNTNGSIFPSDLVLTMMDDGSSPPGSSSTSSSLNSSTTSNGSLSPSSSHQSLSLSSSTPISYPCCLFRCRPNSHPFQERCIPLNEPVKVGRAVARLKALTNNAIFDCKVLSRQHAKLWYENGKFLLQDTKSSNGTFVNNQRLGKCNEESPPSEIYSGDIIQFGVDVTENNRKTTHNCIIIEVKLYHSDGNEALPRSSNGQSLAPTKELDVSSQTLYQLAQYLQEAMHREQMLEQKLEYLQGVIRDTQQASNEGWQAIIDEDRLLARINTLEDQIRIYHTKHPNDDAPIQEIVQLKQTHNRFEEESKNKLEKAILERADAISRNKSLECSLQMSQDELKRFEEQNEQNKQEIQQLVQSLDEQRSLLSEFENKLRESQNRCTELENERHRIQTDFEKYYEQTHHLEALQQQKSIVNNDNDSDPIDQNGLDNIETHGRFRVQSSSKDSIVNHENIGPSDDIPNFTDKSDNEDIVQTRNSIESERDDGQRPTIIPNVHPTDADSVINHHHHHHENNDDDDDDDDEENSPVEHQETINEYSTDVTTMTTTTLTKEEEQQTLPEDQTDLIEAHSQVESLRENLKSTNERLVSMEDVCHQGEERYRSLESKYKTICDELIQLKQRSTKETNGQQLIENQPSQVEQLSKQIVSKQSEHDQLLSIYLCFFLSCYLLIFFLFFCLLSW